MEREILTVNCFCLATLSGLEQFSAENMSDREEPVGRFVVRRLILLGDSVAQKGQSVVRLSLGIGDSRLGDERANRQRPVFCGSWFAPSLIWRRTKVTVLVSCAD
ncbi:MAG: hypothetical protein H0V41_12095 [Pseudonocardiales bacterium]|nr:hypothetical protein [Pseudonocardiales bacterium]